MLEILTYFLYFFILFLLSAFFSASETAIVSLNRARLKARAKKGARMAHILLELLRRPERTLSTILIGNNFVNVLLSSIATLLAVRIIGPYGVLYVTVLVTICLLLFSEITPKTVAAYFPEKISNIVGLPLFVLDRIFFPLTWFTGKLAKKIADLVGGEKPVVSSHLIEEVKEILSPGIKEARIEIFYNLLSFHDIRVEDAMVPRNKLVFVDIKEGSDGILDLFKKSGYSFLPVVKDTLDNIIGFVDVKRFIRAYLRGGAYKDLERFIIPPVFVPELAPLIRAFEIMLRSGKKVAVAVDEYGGISGVIFLDDVLDELGGREEHAIAKLPDGSLVLDSSVPLRDIEEVLGVSFPAENKQKPFSAFILQEVGDIPEKGKKLQLWNMLDVVILDSSKKEIKKVFLRLRD